MKGKIHTLLSIWFLVIIHLQVTAQSLANQSPVPEFDIVDSIYSNILEESRDYWVKLPDNYNPNSGMKYPVVYLLDGFSLRNSLETVYENYWGHYLPQMILVGISNRTNRTRDLTTSQIKMRRGSVMNAETGGAEKFTQFIEIELIPFIDKTYPTTPYRTLIGHSYAGLFTINTLINYSHLFNNYIAIDPSIEWDNKKLLIQAKEKLETKNFKGKSLFVSLAAEQLHMQDEKVTIDNIMEDTTEFSLFARSIMDFSTFATTQKQNGLNFSWKVYPEDLHGTVPLPTIRDGLVFHFKWFQFRSPQKYNNPNTSIATISELLTKQEEIYTSHFGYPSPPMVEELFLGYGFMNMQMGQPDKALMFFEKSIHYYPKSVDGYGAIAEYYESKEEYQKALEYALKAFELDRSDYYGDMVERLKSRKD